jgi:Cft2 family RNA processing exonuclease
MSKVTILGGAGEYGRSCYLVENGTFHVLLDCGVKKSGQGEYPKLTAELVQRLDTVILSHSHEDHSAAIPLLYRMGYRGEVWTTLSTYEQLPSYFKAWEQYVLSSGGQLPYNAEDISSIRWRMLDELIEGKALGSEEASPNHDSSRHPFPKWTTVYEGVRLKWGRSGHLPGSIWMFLEIEGDIVFYSGDYTEESELLPADAPLLHEGKVTKAIIDAAYSMDSESQQKKLSHLYDLVEQTVSKGGQILLPVPAYGRGQELILLLQRQFPSLRLAADHELVKVIRQYAAWSSWLSAGAYDELSRMSQAGQLAEISTEQDMGDYDIIFIKDANLHSPASREYVHKLSSNPQSVVLFTGHLAHGSYGQRMLAQHHSAPSVTDAGSVQALSCHMIRFKVHQGINEVKRMIKTIKADQSILVHADKDKTDQLQVKLTAEGCTEVYSLQVGDEL